jgi:hypothetical protein
MTTDTTTAAPAPLVIDTTDDRDRSGDLIPFQLQAKDPDTGDMVTHPDVLTARRPKMAIMLELLAALGDETNEIRQALALDGLLDKVLVPDDVPLLRARLKDPDDDLDVLGLVPILTTLVGRWYGGPTTKPSGSPRTQRSSGRRSTASKRSKG